MGELGSLKTQGFLFFFLFFLFSLTFPLFLLPNIPNYEKYSWVCLAVGACLHGTFRTGKYLKVHTGFLLLNSHPTRLPKVPHDISSNEGEFFACSSSLHSEPPASQACCWPLELNPNHGLALSLTVATGKSGYRMPWCLSVLWAHAFIHRFPPSVPTLKSRESN